MTNLYRVDRAESPATPCGMNSICYIGDAFPKALNIFNTAKPGFNTWNQPDQSFGLLLSRWTGTEYKVLRARWPDTQFFLFDVAGHDLFGPFGSHSAIRAFAEYKGISAYAIVSQTERHSTDLASRVAIKP